MKKGDVYWINIKNRLDHVNDGVRPCVIVQNNRGNMFSPNIIVVPLTTKLKKTEMSTHVIINEVLEEKSMAMCEQIINISKENIVEYIGTLSEPSLKKINVGLLNSLGIL